MSPVVKHREHINAHLDTLQEVFSLKCCGVKRRAQINQEADVRAPTAGYLAAVARHGVDVLYVLTGLRSVAVAHMSESMRERYNRLVDDFMALPDDLQVVACDCVGAMRSRPFLVTKCCYAILTMLRARIEQRTAQGGR